MSRQVTATLTERERNIAAYALAFYAKELDKADAEKPYNDPLEDAPECRALEAKLRRLRVEEA